MCADSLVFLSRRFLVLKMSVVFPPILLFAWTIPRELRSAARICNIRTTPYHFRIYPRSLCWKRHLTIMVGCGDLASWIWRDACNSIDHQERGEKTGDNLSPSKYVILPKSFTMIGTRFKHHKSSHSSLSVQTSPRHRSASFRQLPFIRALNTFLQPDWCRLD